MRSLLFACATALVLGGFSGCAQNIARNNCYRPCDCPCPQGQAQCQCSQPGCPDCYAQQGNGKKGKAPGAYKFAGLECEGGPYGRHGHDGLGGLGGHLCNGHRDGPPSGPPSAQVAYPYYTLRGPRDFLLNNPPPIGP